MTGFLYSIGGFLVALAILVTVHEFGHFWVARKLNIKVLKFSVGFGRPLWSRRSGRDDTEYVVAAIPLGGYVKMLDETEEEVPAAEAHRAFNRQPIWKRTAVVLAGPMFNFLFAIVAYWAVSLIGVEDLKPVIRYVAPDSIAARAGFQAGDEILSIDGRETRGWGEHRLYVFNEAFGGHRIPVQVRDSDGRTVQRTLDLGLLSPDKIDSALVERGLGMSAFPLQTSEVGKVRPGEPAEQAGLRPGDRITAVNGAAVATFLDLVRAIQPHPGEPLTLEVVRDGARIKLTVTPRAEQRGDEVVGLIGIEPVIPDLQLVTVRYGPLDGLVRGIESTWIMSAVTVKMLFKIVRLEVSARNISGPLTIAQYAGQTAQVGLDRFLLFLAVVSVSLGVINLLPIPVLDGGHLLYHAAEAVTGGPLPKQVLLWGQQIGILLLVGLMSLAFYNDILRLLQ